MNLTRLFELIDDNAFISVLWEGFAEYEYQGRKGSYFYQDDDIVVVSISENKEDGIVLTVTVEDA